MFLPHLLDRELLEVWGAGKVIFQNSILFWILSLSLHPLVIYYLLILGIQQTLIKF